MMPDRNIKQKKDDLYWLSVADKVAEKSKCYKREIGVVVLDVSGRVISTAYNGHPRKTHMDNMCTRKNIHTHKRMHLGYCCHAELNAIIFANFTDLKEATIYITAPPCEACAPYILQSGIDELVYYKDGYKEDGIKLIRDLTNLRGGLTGFIIRSYDRPKD